VAISLVALFIILAAVMGTTAMVATIAYLLHRIRVIEGHSESRTSSRQLLERVTELGDDLFAMQEQISAMTERLDFTEKLLMNGDDEADSDLRQ
jgi:hypothetical protein